MTFTPARAIAVAFTLVFAATSCTRARGGSAAGGEARRIVSVSPGTTEALYAIGAGDRAVGRSKFCDWPREAAALPVVGGFASVDLEAVLQLQPDLVVGAPGPASDHLGEQLRSRGIVAWFPSIDSFAAIDAMIVGLGERTGHARDAQALVYRIDDAAGGIERALDHEPAPRVLVVLQASPIVAAGPKDFIDEMVRRARAVNVLAEGGPWQTLGFEQVMQLDPDILVDASHVEGGAPSGITPTAQGWKQVRAVQRGRVAALHDPTIIRPGPRVAEGLASLARALHPGVALPAP
jgi:iron complex transport system substrate-binding protein